MKITIKGQEIELFYTYRMHILYENITGESLVTKWNNIVEAGKSAALFYSCIISSAKKQKIDLDLNFQEFMDWLDDNGGYVLISEFIVFISKLMKDKYELTNDEEEKEEDLPKSTKKAKN